MKSEASVHNNAICYIVGANYINALKVSLYSLHKFNNIEIDIVFFYDNVNVKKELLKLQNKFKFRFIFKKINTKLYNNFIFDGANRQWEFNPAYRFEVFKLSNYEKVLYVDCDTLITSNIEDIFNKNIDFGACRLNKKLIPYYNNPKTAFNAGILLISKKYLNKKVLNDLVLFCKKNIKLSGNQIVLNSYFGNNTSILPQIYNVTTDILTNELLENGKIFHFVGEKKPWNTSFNESFNSYVLNNAGSSLLIRLFLRYKNIENQSKLFYGNSCL